jgi:hypothetical protein
MYEYDNDGTVNELVSSHSDHNYDNDGIIDELVSSHSDHDYDNDGTIDELVSSHSLLTSSLTVPSLSYSYMYQQTCPNFVYGYTHPETMIYAHCNEDILNIVNCL